jgi:hypothetical protein
MKHTKKIVILAILAMSSGSLLAVKRAKINYIAQAEGDNKLGERVTIKIWRAQGFLSQVIIDKLRSPFKTVSLSPNGRASVVLPHGPYWVQVFGEEGRRLTRVGAPFSHGFFIPAEGATYNVIVEEKKAGWFGLRRKIVLKSGDLDIKETSQPIMMEDSAK